MTARTCLILAAVAAAALHVRTGAHLPQASALFSFAVSAFGARRP